MEGKEKVLIWCEKGKLIEKFAALDILMESEDGVKIEELKTFLRHKVYPSLTKNIHKMK